MRILVLVLVLVFSLLSVACPPDFGSPPEEPEEGDDDTEFGDDDDADDDTTEPTTTTTTTTTTVPPTTTTTTTTTTTSTTTTTTVPTVTFTTTTTSTTTTTTTSTTTTTTTTTTSTTTTTMRPVEFISINAGTFTMGSPEDEPGRDSGETQHEVTLTGDFEMSIYETTQIEFETLMGWDPSNYSACGLDCPVEMVSWFDAVAYANELSADAGFVDCYVLSDVQCEDGTNAGENYMFCMNDTWGGIDSATIALNGVSSVYDCQGYRLPTEAEWEYATRAGTTMAYHNGLGSDDGHLGCETPFHLTDIAWYCGNAGGTTHLVGQLIANNWGLYDMSGNVYEWAWDRYASSYPGTVTDPEGPGSGSRRVNRGGSWDYYARYCRSARRDYDSPGDRAYYLGFRLARSIE